MRAINLKLSKENTIKRVDFDNVSLDMNEFLTLGCSFLALTAKTILNQRASDPGYTEETSKKDRAYMHDLLVAFVSDLANQIYPEGQDEQISPEELLAKLDAAAKEKKND